MLRLARIHPSLSLELGVVGKAVVADKVRLSQVLTLYCDYRLSLHSPRSLSQCHHFLG
jgi:hypothetical protein